MNGHIHKEWYHQQNWQNQNYSFRKSISLSISISYTGADFSHRLRIFQNCLSLYTRISYSTNVKNGKHGCA